MPGKVFVNYRRDDERATAARIRDRLAATFGASNVFMDVDNLMAGQRFDKELERALAETDVFVAVIGPRWLELLTERQASGERDYVRDEIVGALQRGIVVIPVLVERTPLPHHDALPEDIRDLILHQKHIVTHERFGRDVEDLVEAIRFGRRAARPGTGKTGAAIRWAGAVVLALLVLGGGVLTYQMGAPNQVDQVAKAEEAAEKARQDEIKRVAEAATARKKADEETKAKRASEEAVERQRLALLKAEQDRQREADTMKKANEEARAKAEAGHQSVALLEREEQRMRAEVAAATLAAEAAKKKADDDARLEAATAKQRADEEGRAKQAAEKAAELKRRKQEEEGKEVAEETKIAALPKIEKRAGSGSFAGSWTVTWHGTKCTPSSGSYSIRIEGDYVNQPGSALAPSGRVRWSKSDLINRHPTFGYPRGGDFWGGLGGTSGSGRFRVGRVSNPVCTGTWTAKRN
jgi:hypothetical protein